MRHKRLRRKLGLQSAHRKSLLRNLVRGLVLNKRIRTTHARAKEASAFADSMITIAKRGGLHARRTLISKLGSDDIAKRLVNDIAPHFQDRQGGYTRVLRLTPRPGDQSEMALLEFTAVLEKPEEVTETETSKKKKKPKKKTAPKKDAAAPSAEKKSQPKKEAASETVEETPETEKKGGFLGSLRKFLKGD